MKKFKNVADRYIEYGISQDNIEFAIQEVVDGTKREYIVQSLTAEYRGMTTGQAKALLDDLYHADGGEFRRENRRGYFWAFVLLLIGVVCSLFTYHVWTKSGIISFKIVAGAIVGLAGGIIYLLAIFFGLYRDEDQPF